MKPVFRVLGAPLFIGLLLLISLSPAAGAANTSHTKPFRLPMSPLSGGVLMARAIHAGQLHVSGLSASTNINPSLTCSPAPCTLPNVQASGGNGSGEVNETPIAANPANANQLLTGGNDYNCGSIQGFYASNDAGSTWNHTCMSNLPGSGGCGDPGVGYDLNGVAYITGVDCNSSPWYIAFEKSTNNGATWSAPAVAVNATFSGGLTDKEWLQIDDTPSSPHANCLYISTTQFSPNNNSEISVSHSCDGGSSWTTKVVDTVQTYPNIDQFSDLAIGKDGTIYVSWMRCTANGPSSNCGGTNATMVMATSTTGGNTWSSVHKIGMAHLAPDTCGAFYGCIPNTSVRVSNVPAIDIDNSSGSFAGRLYVVDYTYTGAYMKVQVTTSSTGGKTWTKPRRVTPKSDTHDQFFPWLTVSSTGTVGVTWNDRRNDPSNHNYQEYAALSTDGGVTYGTNIQLTTTSSDPNVTGFIGDYTGNIWDGTTLYASWSDTRTGTTQDEVGGYRVS